MKYTAEAFDEWWFTTQFDRAYWQVNSQKHQTEYKWAKLAWDAARRDLLEEVERLNRVFANQGNLREEIVELKSQLQAAQALAATHLADQDYLCAKEIFYSRIPNDNQRAEHFCQGAVLMAKNADESPRMVYLKLPEDKRRKKC